MLSCSLLRFQSSSSSPSAPSASSIPDPSMGKLPDKSFDSTGNVHRSGGFFRRVQKSFGFAATYAQNKPIRFTGWVVVFFASIFWYEANVTHGGRVRSWSHSSNEYQIDDSEEGRNVRRIKAEKVVAVSSNQGASSSSSSSSSTASATTTKTPQPETKSNVKPKPRLAGYEEGGDNFARPSSTLFVTRGHVQEKENNWNVRNHERNWSILAQDHYKQKDSYAYRLERSKDDDFGRHASKPQ